MKMGLIIDSGGGGKQHLISCGDNESLRTKIKILVTKHDLGHDLCN